MRVAYISADPGVPVFGRKGCSIHAQEVLRAMSARGAKIDLFATSLGGDPPPGLEMVRVQSLPPAPKGELAAREQLSLAANADLQRSLERAAPFDFIYERYSLWSSAGMDYAQKAGIPGLLEINAPLIEEQVEHRGLVDRAGAAAVAERAFSDAKVLLAVSEEVAAYVERFPGAAGKVRVLPNGVDPGRFPPDLAPSLPGPPGAFTVGFVGTLKPWHGVEILVEAFARLHQKNPSARLLIVGDGPEMKNLQADLARRGLLDKAHFTGAVAAREVPGLLASMNVAVAPYPELARFYFSPLKVYEYMAAGLPVVASRIGQLTRLIEPDVTGLLVKPGDAGELASALDRLSRDPALRERLGKSARAAVLRDHTWDAVVARIFEFVGFTPGARPSKGRSSQEQAGVAR
jgi:glycosyltransferase involved in cell wall biosynthesis